MSTPIDTPAEEALTELAERFEHWRQSRTHGRARIPKDLWDQAVALSVVLPNIHQKPADKLFYAGITGLGCNITVAKLAQISKDINQSSLERIVLTYFSHGALLEANDSPVNTKKASSQRWFFKNLEERISEGFSKRSLAVIKSRRRMCEDIYRIVAIAQDGRHIEFH